MKEEFFQWGSFYIDNKEVNLANLISIGGLFNTFKMLLRYRAKNESIYNSAIRRDFAKKLYEKYHIRVEGFSSPLNSRFIGFKGMKIYSLFYDTDCHFGSLGSFFENYPPENVNILLNPPYIDELLFQVSKRIVEILDRKKNNDIIFVGPYDGYLYHRTLKRYVVFSKIIEKGFLYEDNVGNLHRISQRLYFCYFSLNKKEEIAKECFLDMISFK